MKKVVIVYHSGFGHTAKVAQHVHLGVSSVDGIQGSLFELKDGHEDPRQLNDADALIFGSPTYMGSGSAVMKQFMEASSSLFAERAWKDKLAAGFTNSHSLSGDKLNTLMQFVIFAMQHSMIWVGMDALNSSPDYHPGQQEAINRVGSYAGLMAQSENDTPKKHRLKVTLKAQNISASVLLS